jgi:diadenosine tetraphosphatase ApaH/serine/threonine PP2A family protein phosphatase
MQIETSNNTSAPLYIMGDIHGQRDKLLSLLEAAGLIDGSGAWIGGSSRLWFMGDFFDRGDDGIGVVERVIRWQKEAAAAGGVIGALLGNHEILFLAAHRFGDRGGFLSAWKRNGGQERDLARAKMQQIAWLRNLPALARVDHYLLMHADAIFYRDYGSSIEQVNNAISDILHDDNPFGWERLLEQFSQRLNFTSARPDGITRASDMLRRFGGRQIIHGHTPIQYLTDELNPSAPLIYSVNLCVDVDGGMYLGGSGFVYRAPLA